MTHDDLLVSDDLVALLPPRGAEGPPTEAEHTYQRLRAAILLGRVPSGHPLVESELMARLGVGRTPLREAVRSLMHDGLVEVLPRRGTYVSPVDLRDYPHLVAVRRGLEAVVAHQVIAGATRAQRDGFAEFVGRATTTPPSAEADLALDTEFHRRTLAMTSNRYLVGYYWRLVGESMRMLNAAGAPFETAESLLPTFVAANEAIQTGDAPALHAALLDHVGSFEDRLVQMIRRWPGAHRPH